MTIKGCPNCAKERKIDEIFRTSFSSWYYRGFFKGQFWLATDLRVVDEEMALFNPEVRRRTDALDAAGNTTAAIGKGFAIGSAALVSLALPPGR